MFLDDLSVPLSSLYATLLDGTHRLLKSISQCSVIFQKSSE